MTRRIRITLDNLALGFKKAEGLLYVEDKCLVLELQQMDALLEVVKEDIKTYRVALPEIDSVSLIKKWFKRYIIIEAKNMRAMQDIPGVSQGRLKLAIPRDEKEDARQLVSHVQLLLSEQKLQELDQ